MSTQPELFAALPGVALPISDHELLFMPQGLDDRHVMTQDVHAAMAECAVFASLPEHAQYLSEQFPAITRPNIERVLTNLVSRGLLQSATDFRQQLQAGQPPATTGKPLSTICLISEGHPAALESMLNSISEANKRDLNVALMDVAETAEYRARKAWLMAEFGRKTGQRVVLLESKRERLLAERLAQFPEFAASIEQLIGKSASPRARALNTIALLHRGEKILVLDDHQRLRSYGPGQFDVDVGMNQFRMCEVFGNVDTALQQRARSPALWDLAQHTLGVPAMQMIQNTPLAGRQIAEFAGLRQARAMRLTAGSIGSADTTHSLWAFAMSAEHVAKLNTADKMAHAIAGDAVHLFYPQASLAPSAGKAACAFDLTQSHGFAMGQGEGADRSLAAMSHFADPNALELTIPVSIERRAPQLPRERTNREAMPFGFARFMADQIRTLGRACYASQPSARWAWLAGQCRDLAESDRSIRNEFLWSYLNTRRAELLGELQHYLMQNGAAPEAFRNELLATIQSQAEILIQSRGYSLEGFDQYADPATELSLHLRQTADMASAWNQLWSAAAPTSI